MNWRVISCSAVRILNRSMCLLLVCCLLIPAFSAAASDNMDMVKPGDLLTFSHYEQDNDLSNGPEPISWRVLSLEGKKALVISEKCLDIKPYSAQNRSVTWETSTLRVWLNSAFLWTTFTSEEQKSILTTSVKNEVDPYWERGNDRDTSDKVFLLSVSEAESLFLSDDDRMARITPYALAQGEYEYDAWKDEDMSSSEQMPYALALGASEYDFCNPWWLRSIGESSLSYWQAAVVERSGNITDLGVDVGAGEFAIRPALWIDVDSAIAKSTNAAP